MGGTVIGEETSARLDQLLVGGLIANSLLTPYCISSWGGEVASNEDDFVHKAISLYKDKRRWCSGLLLEKFMLPVHCAI